MTGDATLRSIYSAADETVADLERLNQKGRAQQGLLLPELKAIVARLDFGSGTAEDETVVAPRRNERGGDRSPTAPADSDPAPFVPLPQRTTHGGRWGPKMVEKLTNIALEREARRW